MSLVEAAGIGSVTAANFTSGFAAREKTTLTDDASIGWLNGQTIPYTEMALPVWDLGVVAGASITEMARTYGHEPFRLEQHIGRLTVSCAELGFTLPWSTQELVSAARNVIAANAAQVRQSDDLGIVIFVTAGCNPTYLGGIDESGSTVGIHTFRLPFEMWRGAAADGVRLQIPERRQIDDATLPVDRKTRNRLHWWLADRDANKLEPGSRALLLDSQGRITETSTACFYAVVDGSILTARRNVLDSMSRRLVAELAEKCGIRFEQTDILPEQIPQFEEAFVSSTPVGIFTVSSINGMEIGTSSATNSVSQLRTQWEQLTGIDPTKQILANSS